MPPKNVQATESDDDEKDILESIEQQMGKAKEYAAEIFGATVTPDVVVDVYDVLMAAKDKSEVEELFSGLMDARAASVRLFGETVPVEVTFQLFERAFGADEDEDEEDDDE